MLIGGRVVDPPARAQEQVCQNINNYFGILWDKQQVGGTLEIGNDKWGEGLHKQLLIC